MMVVHDIVQVVGPNPQCSYEPNTRTLVEFSEDEALAESRASLFNEMRGGIGWHFEVESHDEESPERAFCPPAAKGGK